MLYWNHLHHVEKIFFISSYSWTYVLYKLALLELSMKTLKVENYSFNTKLLHH